MTFQTTPYKQWIFPDQAYEMNRGVPFSPSQSRELHAEIGAESPWAEHERQVAMDRVQNTIRAEKGMEGQLNTTARSQRYDRPASRSAVPNGVFHGSPMDYITSGNAFRGGRIYTKEGQEWLATRLKQRVEELDAISTGNFSKGPPSKIDVSPYNMVDTLLQQIFASFGTGSFTSGTATALNQLLGEILKIGATITPSQLTMYAKAIQKLNETIRGYRAGEIGVDFERQGIIREAENPQLGYLLAANPAEERLRLVQSMQTTLKLLNGAIREIARTIYDPQSSRQQVMATLQSRLLGEQIAEYVPGFAEEQRQAAVRGVPGEIPLGRPATGSLLGPTAEEREAAQREEEEAALNLAEGGFPGFQGPPRAATAEELAAMAGQGKKRRGRPRKY